MPKTFADRTKQLEAALKEVEKIGVSTDFEIPEPEFYSTGNMAIDAICGGGIAIGKIAEFAGPPASGKTTTAVSTAAGIIEQGGIVAFYDYERAIDKPYFRALGIDPDDSKHFLYFAPRTLEDGANSLRKLLDKQAVDLAVFDSVARMATNHELTAETGKVLVADRAKMMYQFIRQVIDPLADAQASIIFLNHLLEKVDATFMGQQMAARGIKQYTSPGGNAIPYNASQRLQFKKSGQLTNEELNPITNEVTKTIIGNKHEVKVVKNKVGRPEGKVEVINIMGEGFSQSRTALEVLKAYKAIHKNGAWFEARDPRLVEILGDKKYQGENNVYDTLFGTPSGRGQAINIAQELLAAAYNDLPETSSDEGDLEV